MTTPQGHRGFGVTAGIDLDVIRALGPVLSKMGYESFWTNDTEDGDGIATAEAFHTAGVDLRIGLGILALDRHSPMEIAADPRLHMIGTERLIVGLGVGDSRDPLPLARHGLMELRAHWPGLTIFLAALGPSMCRLAGELADGVLLNWVTPSRIAWARQRVAEGAGSANRDPSDVATWAYVRTVVGEGAAERLEAERVAYDPSSITAHHYHAYRNQFLAMDYDDELIGAASPSVIESLDVYASMLDGTIARAVPSVPTVESLIEVAAAAAPPRPKG